MSVLRKLKNDNMLLVLMILLSVSECFSEFPKVINTGKELAKSTVELIEDRGYLATAFNFSTSDGYVLNIVRANNPLINNGKQGGMANKSVVILVHGITCSSQVWVINSRGARPQNYGHLRANDMTEGDLVRLLGQDPTTNSFLLTLLNFGHEVWLMDRRSTMASQANRNQFENSGKTVVHGGGEQASGVIPKLDAIQLENGRNPKYWNFSFDEQASRDLPELVDFVLEQTRRKKVTLLGHSLGAAIILMSLADGKLTKDKLQHSMLWAPSMDLGHGRTNLVINLAPTLEPLLINYLGGVFPTILTPLVQTVMSKMCTPRALRFICQRLMLSLVGGDGGPHQRIEPEFFVTWPIPTGSHEAVQLMQSVRKRAMHHFDYLSPRRNLLAYGSSKAPIYNVTNIDFEFMSLWMGNTDSLVSPADTEHLLRRLRVPVEIHRLGAEGDFFQHFSFLLHSNVSRLLNIPALRSLERADTM